MLIEENLKEIFHTGKKLKNLDLFKDLLENKLKLLNKGKKKYEQEDYKIIKEIYQSIIKKNLLPFSLDRIERNRIQNLKKNNTLLDYLIYRYKFQLYPKKRIVSKFPIYILIEPTSVCNLRCTMCFQVDKTFTKKKYMGFMDLNLYKKIIDEAHNSGTKAITLASRGEPTLHPQIIEMVNYASNKFIDLKLNTNATKLDEKLAHGLLSSGLTELVFSLDSDNKKQYEEIRVRGKWEEVYKNIKNFYRIKSKYYKNSTLHTRVSAVKFKKDQNIKKISKFWESLVDTVTFVKTQQRWDTYANKPHPEIDHACNYLWERMYVWYDGACNPCDPDYKSYLKIGDFKNKKIKDIWHSKKLTELRKKHLSKNRSQYNPCDRCGI